MESKKIVLGGARMGSDGIHFQWDTERYMGKEIRLNKFMVSAPTNSMITPEERLPQGMSDEFWDSECLNMDPATGSCGTIIYTRKSPETDLAILKGMTWADIAAKWPEMCEMGYDEELKQFCMDNGKVKNKVVDVLSHPVLRDFFAQRYRSVDEGVSSEKIRSAYKEELCEIFSC